MQKNDNTVRLLRYNNHTGNVSNINAVFQSFRCPNCHTFFGGTINLDRHLTTCSERVKNVYPRNVYQIRKTFFDKLDYFSIKYTSEPKTFQKISNIRPWINLCPRGKLQRHKYNNLDWGTYPDICINHLNLVQEPTFFCKSDPHHLVSSFIRALENWASQSRAKMKNLFLDIKTTIKVKLGIILEKLTQNHKQRENANFDMSQDDCDNEICTSTQFLQIQKNQLIDLQESLERYCNVLLLFGFNKAKYDLNLIKSYLLPILVNERDIEPTVIKKANQFILFKFGDIELFDIMNFPGAATSLDSFLKANKTWETNGFSPTNGFTTLTKCRIQTFPHMTPFTVNFVAANLLKPITRTMLFFWKVDWPQNKPSSN